MRLKVFTGSDKEQLKRQVSFFRDNYPELNILNIEKDLTYAMNPNEKKQYRYKILYVEKNEG